MDELNRPLDSAHMEGLSLNNEMLGYLSDSAKWARFLAIVGFVVVGLMIIASFFIGTMASQYGGMGMSGGFITVIYLIFAVIYFFPLLYLYRFGNEMRNALNTKDNILLTESFYNLRKHYNFIGVLTMIILILYGAMLLIGLIGGIGAF